MGDAASSPGQARRSRLRRDLLRAASWLIALLPAGSGQGRLALLVHRWWVRAGIPWRARVRMRGGARLELDLTDRIQAWAFLTRDYDPPLMRFLERRLRSGGTLFDIGAHVGIVSLIAASRCRGLEVHAFEPDPQNAADFRGNLALNPGVGVRLNERALAQYAGSALLRRAPESSERGTGSIAATGAAAEIDDAIEVPTTTLDDYISEQGIDRVEVLKLDVEGLEPAVLAGCEVHLRPERIGCVVCEVNEPLLRRNGWSRSSLTEMMSARGYRASALPPVGLRRVVRRPRHEVEDVVFVPS